MSTGGGIFAASHMRERGGAKLGQRHGFSLEAKENRKRLFNFPNLLLIANSFEFNSNLNFE
jgi:hypothetical protein